MVNETRLSWNPATIPTLVAGLPVNQTGEPDVTLTIDGITADTVEHIASYSVVSGLPKGLELDQATGRLIGAPAIAGVFPIVVVAKGLDGTELAVVNNAPIELIVSPPPNATTDSNDRNQPSNAEALGAALLIGIVGGFVGLILILWAVHVLQHRSAKQLAEFRRASIHRSVTQPIHASPSLA